MKASTRRGAWLTAIGIAFVLGGVTVAPLEADAALLICKRKKRLTLREDKCKKKEQMLDAAELGVTGPAGPAGSDGPMGAPGVSPMLGFSFSLTDGETKTIATSGPLTMTASCKINDGGMDTATIAIDTSVDNAAGDGATSGPDPDLDIGEQVTSVESIATGMPVFDEGEAGARAPDGSILMAAENHLLTGVNVHGVIGTCVFSGVVVVGDLTN